jgi:hypothetical protein
MTTKSLNSVDGRPTSWAGRNILLLSVTGLIVVGMLCTVVIIWVLHRTAVGLDGMLKPQISVTTVVNSSVNTMKQKLALVVEEADITAEVSRSESYTWWGVYFGTTAARVRSTGCHIEYVIPLDSFGTSNMEAVTMPDGSRIVRVILPEPQVNENIVEINYTNLEVEASSAWARFNKGDVTEDAKRLLRNAAVEEGKRPWHIKAVEVDAQPEVRALLNPLIEALQPDVKFEVVFK